MNNRQEVSKTWNCLCLLGGWGLCLILLIALADVQLADSHSAGPVHPVAAAPGSDNAGGGGGGGGGGAQPGNTDDQPTRPRMRMGNNDSRDSAEDRSAEEAWMQQYAPHHWQYYESILPTDKSAAEHILNDFAGPRIHMLYRLKQNDTVLYELRMKRVTIEDDAFGALQDLKAAKNPQAKAAATALLKQNLSDLYDNTLAERQTRVNELQKMINDEQARIKNDQIPAQHDKHVDYMLDRAERTGSIDSGGRDNGPGPHMHGGGPNGPISPPPETPATQP